MSWFKKINLHLLLGWVRTNQDFLIINLVLVLKVVFFSLAVGLGVGTFGMVMASAAVLLILSCGFTCLPYRARTWLLLLFDAVVSVVLLADLLFFRFFHSVISIPVLFEAGQVEGVSSSVVNLFHKWDFLLFADFVVLLPYFILLSHKQPQPPSRVRRRLVQVAAILVICVLSLSFTSKTMAANFGKNAYIGLNWNNTVLENMGILNFHLFDLYNYWKESHASQSLDNDKQALEQWMQSHRQQGPNKFYGLAKGKNLIVVQMEALQGFAVGRSINGQEITPNLNKLINSSMYFDNYFTQIGEGNTSDAEFMDLNSLYPAPNGSVYIMRSNNTYQSLPWVLKNNGFTGSYVFHGNTPEFWNRDQMYPKEGFDKFYNLKDGLKLDEKLGMGLSDESLFRQVTSNLTQFKPPFFSFTITLSAHYPFVLPQDKQTLNIPKGQYSDMFVNYLQAQHYADQALGEFLDALKAQGLLDNSVLVVYGDHFGTGWTNQDIQKFLGMDQPLNDYTSHELNKVPLLIHLPGGNDAGVNHITGGQMDLYPTLVNLFGLDKKNLFYFGRDLLNEGDGFAAFRVYAPDGSFVTNEIFYLASKDGIFEHGAAYDRKTGQKVDLKPAENGYKEARWEVNMSDLILETNGLPQLIPKIH